MLERSEGIEAPPTIDETALEEWTFADRGVVLGRLIEVLDKGDVELGTKPTQDQASAKADAAINKIELTTYDVDLLKGEVVAVQLHGKAVKARVDRVLEDGRVKISINNKKFPPVGYRRRAEHVIIGVDQIIGGKIEFEGGHIDFGCGNIQFEGGQIFVGGKKPLGRSKRSRG